MHWFELFLFMPFPTQNSPSSSCHQALGRRSYSFHQAAFFRKSVSPNSRKAWRKLWLALSKFYKVLVCYDYENIDFVLWSVLFPLKITGKNCVLLNSWQEFIKINTWLLLKVHTLMQIWKSPFMFVFISK